jgi:hypothetical protein
MKKHRYNNSTLLLEGTISKLERSRRSHDFVLTEVQHQQIGATVVGASVMGMSAVGIGLISMAGNSDEEADWVEFEVDGKQVEGWLWMMPMRNGDSVKVVAERMGCNRYIAYAVKRDSDDLIAIYPHATAGRKVHYRKSINAWIWCSTLLYLASTSLFVIPRGIDTLLDENMQVFLLTAFISCISFFAIIAFRVSRKMMGFVRIAEMIFRTFDWPDVENIDLRKTSRENRRENKLPNFGNLYFRYK